MTEEATTDKKTINATVRMSSQDWDALKEKGISIGHESDTIFYPDSKGRNQARSWIGRAGETSPGGIYRRLKELHEACLTVIESQQKQLENSLHERKQLAEEIQNLHVLLAEILQDLPHNE